MNRWDCDHHGCKSSAVGCQGAIGLRAIGWYFVPGGPLLCPAHRPDPIVPPAGPYLEHYHPELNPLPCAICKGDQDARDCQTFIYAWLGIDRST